MDSAPKMAAATKAHLAKALKENAYAGVPERTKSRDWGASPTPSRGVDLNKRYAGAFARNARPLAGQVKLGRFLSQAAMPQ